MIEEKSKDLVAPASDWTVDWRIVLLLVAAVFCLYGASADDGFHFDDGLILDDANVTNPERWSHFLNPLRLRQVTFFTFYLNHRLGGEEPLGYHLVNIGLHAANGVLLYLLIGPIMGGWIAAAAALMFVSHPVQTEAVVYVYQRSTLLATTFSLIGLLLVRPCWRPLASEHPNRGRRIGLAIASFAFAAWSKEAALGVPLVLVLVSGVRSRLALWVGLGVGGAGLAALTLLAWLGEDTVGIGVIDQVDPWTYLLTQFRVFGTYVRLLLVPYPQSLEYDFAAVDSVWRLGFLAGLAGVAGLIAGGVGLRRRRGSGWAGIGLLAFLVLLAPTSSIIPSRDFAFEHRLYLPLLGVVVFLAVMAARLPRRTAVLALLLVVWGSLAVNRGRAWSADVTLWEDTVDKAPNKVRAWFNLGGAYLAAGDPRAREAFLRVLELDPGSAEAAYNLGIVEHRSGNLVEALAWYERALGQSPGYWPAHNNIGNARALLGDHAGSAEAYLRTLDLNPDYWPAQFNLALAYSAMNRPDQAVPRLRTVLDWEPDFDEARALLALSLVRLGRTGEADEETRRLGAMPESILIDGNPAPLTAPN